MSADYFEDDRASDAIAARHRFEREVCVCGHPLDRHSALGACLVIVPTQLMRADGEPTRVEQTYCHCLDYEERT